MRTDALQLAPGLDLLVHWSPRMSDVFYDRYQINCRQAEASGHLQYEYDQLCRAHEAAFTQIQRFFALTGSLPVAGDYLWHSDRGGETLRIESRTIFSTPDSESLLLVYGVCSDEIEELEACQADNLAEQAI